MKWHKLAQSGSVPVERSSHSITNVGSHIFLFGGEHDPRTPINSDIHSYNVSNGEWTLQTPSGVAPDPRVAHTATVVDSQIYVFGGRSGKEMGEGAYADLHAFDAERC